MMGQPVPTGPRVPTMAPPPAAKTLRRRWSGLLALLGGCSLGREWPNVLYLAIGANRDETINAELRQGYQKRMELVAQGFQQLHPDTHTQFGLCPENRMVELISQRNQAGLGPDLLVVNGDTALRLLAAGLVDPFPIHDNQLDSFHPDELQRLRNPKGQLAGLPLVVIPQLSCFNRLRLSQAPANLQELLNASAKGHPVGLSTDFAYLYWIVGSTGAVPAFETALLGQAPNTAERQALTGWLAWLQNANSQQKVSFVPDQATAEAEFKAVSIGSPVAAPQCPPCARSWAVPSGSRPYRMGRVTGPSRLTVCGCWPWAAAPVEQGANAPSPWDPRRCCPPTASCGCRCRAPRCWPLW